MSDINPKLIDVINYINTTNNNFLDINNKKFDNTDINIILLHLQNNPNIKKLIFSNNNIGIITKLCKFIQQNDINYINLKCNEIKNINCLIKLLKSNNSLTYLNLYMTYKYPYSMMNELFKTFSNENNKLEYFDISYDSLAVKPYDYDILFNSLKENNTLKELYLKCHNITNIDILGETININNTLTTINLSCNYISDINCFSTYLKSNNTLTYLNLAKNKIIDINILAKSLKNNKTLTYLNLKENKINNSYPLIETLKSNKTLTYLNLSNSCFNQTIFCVDVFKHNNTLKKLILKQIKNSGPYMESIFNCLHNNSSLTKLDISNNNLYLYLDSLSSLIKNNKTISILNMHHIIQDNNRFIFYDNNYYYHKSKNEYSSIGISKDILQNIKNIKNEYIPDDKDFISDIPVKIINRFNPVIIRGITSILQSLLVNNTIQILDLSYNLISNDKLIGEVIKNNKTIVSLNVSFNYLSSIKNITEGLKYNKTLTGLYLSENYIKDIKILSETLKTNNTLKFLNLSHNDITNIDDMFESLKYNKTLQALRLNNNNIENIDKDKFKETFTINNTLHFFSVNYYLLETVKDDLINYNNVLKLNEG